MKYALFLLAVVTAFAADPAPSWVREAVSATVPQYPAKVSVVILYQEEHLTVDPEGKRLIRERGALRFLDKGRNEASAYRPYNTKSGKIRDFQAWLITPEGKETTLANKNSILDVALSQNYTYDEARAKVIDCPRGAAAGSVFAWEIVEEEKTIFTQYRYSFQGTAPVLLSRLLLTVPSGWEARGTLMNGGKMESRTDGSTFTWEMRDLPWIADEDYRPNTSSLAPWLGVTYFPASSSSPELKPLGTWTAVSCWLSPMVDAPAEVTPTIQSKASELSAQAKNLMDRIEAAAAFAQQTNYVSIQMNITRGGGYIPHRAEDILKRNYGDCKDKATLMRSLLKAQGIDSYLVAVFSGDREYVKPEWPSPFQFNHAIIAIKVPEDVQSPVIATHPKLGRLLIFDPTDPNTPLGDLPEEEQGSRALVFAGASGDLIQLPLLGPDRNHVESVVVGQISPEAGLKAKLVRTYSGREAARMRDFLNDDREFRRLFERSLSARLGGLTITSASLKPQEQHTLQAAIDVDVLRFGQAMQGSLLLVNPGDLVPGSDYILTSKDRKLPIRIRSRSTHSVIRLKTPSGFAPDEIPGPIRVSCDYGEYQARWDVKDGEILFDQTVRLHDVTAPASDFAKVRDFFDKFAGAQGAPVVLVKK